MNKGKTEKSLALSKAIDETSDKDNNKTNDGIFENEEDCSVKPECLRPTGSNINWVQCDGCQLWYHLFCLFLKPLPRNKDFFCKDCESNPNLFSFPTFLKKVKKNSSRSKSTSKKYNKLPLHLKATKVHEGPTHKCKNCDRSFTKNHLLKKHIKYKHQQENVHEGQILKCHICDQVFIKDISLKLHIYSVHHKKDNGHKGTSENYVHEGLNSTNVKPDKIMHSATEKHHNNKDFDLNNFQAVHVLNFGIIVYKCDICDKSFMLKSSLKKHIENDHGKICHSLENFDITSIPDESFDNMNENSDPIRNYNNESKTKCNFCKEVFAKNPSESFCFEGCYIP